jgi:PTH2 family peptidyl-tRNA hydrolase
VKKKIEHKMVIVIRGDLSLSPGKLAVQVAHAAVICAIKSKKKNKKWFEKWEKEGGKKVVVKVESENDLYPLLEKAKKLGIVAELIKDAGRTEIPPGTVTALGIGPAPDNLIDQITGNLALV